MRINFERLKIKRLHITFLAIVALAIGQTRPCFGQAKESYIFYSGVEAMMLGEFDKSSELFKMVIKENPLHAPSFYYLGRVALMVDQIDNANDLIERALTIDSTNTTYLNTYAQILITQKKYAQAEPLVAKLRQMEPNNQQNYQIGAALLLENRRAEEARKLCEQYENQFGLDERMIEIQRTAYIQTENYYQAEDYMRRVVAAFPNDMEYLLALADLNAALLHDSTAMSLYDRAIEMDSTAVAPRLSKANFYQVHKQIPDYINALIPIFRGDKMAVGDKIAIFEKNFFEPAPYREAFAQVTQLITELLMSAPQDVEVRMLYGRYLTYSGQIEAGVEQYKSMIEEGVSHPDLAERLLQIYFYQKNYADAFALATASYDTLKTSQMMEYRTIAAWLKGDEKEALALCGQAIREYRVDTIQSGFYAIQGDIYDKIGQSNKSYRAYEKSLRLNPNNAGVLNNYAYHLSNEEKQLERALAMAQKANLLSPDNPTYLDTEAWVLFKLKRYVDAQMLMGRVMALDPRPSAEVLLHYGDILYEMGDDFLARNYWKKAAEAGAKAEEIEVRVMREKAKRP